MRFGPGQLARSHAIVAVVLGVVLGSGFGWMVDSGSPAVSASPVAAAGAGASAVGVPGPAATVPAPTATVPPPASTTTKPVADPEPALRASMSDALQGGIAGVPTGTIQAAVMMDGWSRPVIAGANVGQSMRPWSMIKAVTALTLLRERAKSGVSTAGLDEPLQRALQRSDNCAQRQLTVQLERDLGGSLAATGQRIKDTLAEVGAQLDVSTAQHNSQGAYCITPTYKGLPAADAAFPALLLGTTHWRVSDAIRFMHALRKGEAFGATASSKVLQTLQLAKLDSQEPGAEAQLTAESTWGSGAVFADRCWRVAYKGGWGGHAQGRFLAGQMGSVDLAGGRWATFAVMFHPSRQPASDDPGLAGADTALETVLTSVKRRLQQLHPGCG